MQRGGRFSTWTSGGLKPFGSEHGAAAVGRAAVASIQVSNFVCSWSLDDEPVINRQFFTAFDISQRVNKYASVGDVRLAVRFTTVIHPADAAASACSVNNRPITGIKQERVSRGLAVAGGSLHDILPGDACALVLRNQLCSTDILISKDTLSMHGRRLHDESGNWGFIRPHVSTNDSGHNCRRSSCQVLRKRASRRSHSRRGSQRSVVG